MGGFAFQNEEELWLLRRLVRRDHLGCHRCADFLVQAIPDLVGGRCAGINQKIGRL